MTTRSTLLTTTRDTLVAHVRAGNELDAYATFARLVYIAHATEGCEAQGVRLVDLPRLGDVVARAADSVDQYTEIHARMRTILGGAEGEAIAVENLAREMAMDLNAYRSFAVSIARMVASPGAEDTADKLAVADLDMVYNLACAEYGNGHAAGDRARFARCKEDLARALGLDARRAPEWGEMVGRARNVVRRAEMAAARWKWSGVFVLPDARGLWFTAPGAKSDTLVAVIQPRDDGMLSVKVNGQKRTAADDLPAALVAIRAVLGADVPEIPNERSES